MSIQSAVAKIRKAAFPLGAVAVFITMPAAGMWLLTGSLGTSKAVSEAEFNTPSNPESFASIVSRLSVAAMVLAAIAVIAAFLVLAHRRAVRIRQ